MKILAFILGQQWLYTNFPCLLWELGSRARDIHWRAKDWPKGRIWFQDPKIFSIVSSDDKQKSFTISLET